MADKPANIFDRLFRSSQHSATSLRLPLVPSQTAPRSENKLQRKLHDPRIRCAQDLAESGAVQDDVGT